MKLTRTILIACFVLSAAVGLRIEGQTVNAQRSVGEDFTRITQQEIELLLAEVAETNPMVLKRMEEDPEMKRAQLDSLRELLAFASEAKKTGLANESVYRNELENIRLEVTAVNYDRHLNKSKAAKGAFGYISAAAVAGYWGENSPGTVSAVLKAERTAKFEEFLETKVDLLRSSSPGMKDKVITAEDRTQARDVFTKIAIYSSEYAKRSALLPLSFRQKIKLQVKLQQAQFLARLYGENLVARTSATDEEIAEYIRLHPELDQSSKRAKAETILARAQSGEDFAKLANEFSEDPGNKSEQELRGGLYENVNKGVMVAPFERAALALEAGQIAPALVESDFGFHIIKLDRKGVAEPITYDVRHILIATAISDPSDPAARPVPVKEHARKEIESEKERQIIDRIVAANNISVPEDFVIPAATIPGETPKTTPKPKARRARKRT